MLLARATEGASSPLSTSTSRSRGQACHARTLARIPPPRPTRSLEAKAELVAAVRQCLRPGGTFALIDVFKADGESRAEYMRRLRAHLDAKLTEGALGVAVGVGRGMAGAAACCRGRGRAWSKTAHAVSVKPTLRCPGKEGSGVLTPALPAAPHANTRTQTRQCPAGRPAVAVQTGAARRSARCSGTTCTPMTTPRSWKPTASSHSARASRAPSACEPVGAGKLSARAGGGRVQAGARERSGLWGPAWLPRVAASLIPLSIPLSLPPHPTHPHPT